MWYRNRLVSAISLGVLLVLFAAAWLQSCWKAGDESARPKTEPAGETPRFQTIPDDEAFGFNVQLGEAFDAAKLVQQLAQSPFPVQVAAEDASAKMVPGTAGDGTIYFWVTPDPRAPERVGGLTLGADLKTAYTTGRLTKDQYSALVEGARELARDPATGEMDLRGYIAAEAMLAGRANPAIATAAGIHVGSSRAEVEAAYGPPDETVFEYGDTVLIYRGKQAALALRLAGDTVRIAQLFPADCDYLEFREAGSGLGSEQPSQ